MVVSPKKCAWEMSNHPKIGRRSDPTYYAELDLIAVLRRIAEANSNDYFGTEHFLKPVKRRWALFASKESILALSSYRLNTTQIRFIQNPLAEKIYSLYKEETFARFAREDEDTMIVEYCNNHLPL